MRKTRANESGWSVFFAGTFILLGASCAAGNEPAGGTGDEEEQWGGSGGSSSSGMGGSGESSNSASSSSGSSCGTPEVCNGKDDDCDGFIDNDVTTNGDACDTGQMGLCGVGVLDCQDGKSVCVEKNTPQVEICDGYDNDCNGKVDDGNPGGGDTCMTGLPGPCALGVVTCADGVFKCEQQNQAVVEVCGDMTDNDCNGTVDNGCGGMGGMCSHSPCTPGGPLATDCEPCVTVICNIDSYCCTTQWDLTCYTKALDMCPGC